MKQLTIALRNDHARSRLLLYKDLHSRFFSFDLDEGDCLALIGQHVRGLLEDHSDLLIQILFLQEATGPPRAIEEITDEDTLTIRWSLNRSEIGIIVPLASFSGMAIRTAGPYLIDDPTQGKYRSVYKAFAETLTRTELALVIRREHSAVPLGVVNIESPRIQAFRPDQVKELVELVALVSPILVAVRRRIEMARQARKAVQYAMEKYLLSIAKIYSHKFGREVAIDFALATLEDPRATKAQIAWALADLRLDYTWINTALSTLWDDISSVAQVEPTRVGDLLENIRKEENHYTRKYLTIDTSIDSLPPVRASRLLKEHLRNLIVNSVQSVKHREARESVTDYVPMIKVRGQTVAVRQRRVELTDKDEIAELNQKVRISVWDNGLGVSKDDMGRILQPGFTTKGAGGHGLGLSGARGYARELGGNLTVHSVEGEYCEVSFELPQFADGD